jgi:CRISPR-associated protein Cas2
VYVLVVYDVEADRTRIFLKLCRRYLTHVQNSVLEGEISAGDLERLRGEIEERLKPGESVIVYELSSEKYVDRTVWGEDPMEDSRFL